MAHLKVLPILILLITFSFPAWVVRELVDDFNGATIDFQGGQILILRLVRVLIDADQA